VRGAIEVYELGRQRGHRRDVWRQVDSTRLGGAVRAAQQADSSSHVLVGVAVIRVGAGHRGARGGGPVRHVAPVAVVAVGMGVAVVRENSRLVRLAVRGAVGRVALDGAAAKVQVRVRRIGADGVVVHVRGRGGFGGAQVVAHVGRARGRRRGRVVAVVADLVHGDEDGGGLEQLDLLVLGDEQLGGVLPLRGVFPTRAKVNAVLFCSVLFTKRARPGECVQGIRLER
jgi:hypothetical protein